MYLSHNQYAAFDGEYEIIFSNTFNVYENTLAIILLGYVLTFVFVDTPNQPSSFDVKLSPTETNTASIILHNFRNPLGIGTTGKTPIINLNDGKAVYFALHAKSLNDASKYLQVNITFYQK